MFYKAMGLFWNSEIAFPELAEDTGPVGDIPVDRIVEVCLADVPETLPGETRLGPFFSHADRRCLYTLPGIGRIRVEDGRRILVQMAPEGLMSDMRTYLTGSGIGTILHQRGMVPLHVSAVLGPKGVIAFTGQSGAGKSTMAAEVGQRLGWPVLGDDLATLSLRDGVPVIEGGVRRLRLWADALDRLGWSTENLVRDTHRTDKYVSYKHGVFHDGAHAFEGLYEILPDAAPGEPVVLRGADKVASLLGAVYRPWLVPVCGNQRIVHDLCLAVSGRIICWKGGRISAEDVGKLM